MNAKHFIQHHPVIIYFFMVFLISWGMVVVLAGPGNLPIDADKSQELLPLLYVTMLLGPGIAGLLMIGLLEGRIGFHKLKSRFLKWQIKFWWYLIAFFATPVLASLLLIILGFVSPAFQVEIISSDNSLNLILNGIIAGVMVGIFEELGWTGFVIPRLNVRYNILTSGLIVGVLWGAWHFILFWERDSFSNALPLLILLGRLFAWLPPFRIIMIWIYRSTESLLLIILTHVSLVFTTTVIVPMILTGKDLLIWIITWGLVLWTIVIVIVRVNPKMLHRQSVDFGENE